MLAQRFGKHGSGKLERTGTGSVTEGVGQGRVTANMDGAPIDDAFTVDDRDSIRMVFEMLDKEGLFLGASSCLNMVAAVKVAEKMPPNSVVVTLACDGAYRYQSRLFSRSWLDSKGLLDAVDPKYHSMLVD